MLYDLSCNSFCHYDSRCLEALASNFSAYPLLGFIVQVILVTFIILLVGEIMPKLYANRSRLKVAIFMAGPLTLLTYVFRPLSTLLITSTSVISKRIAKKDSISIDQLSKALELTEDAEINSEKEILEGIVRFSNISAIDIIQPRINITAIDIEDHFRQVKEIVIQSGYSRLPVFRENLDNIEGILYVKDLLAHLHEPEDFRWQALLRPAYFVPGTKKSATSSKSSKSRKSTWRLSSMNTAARRAS